MTHIGGLITKMFNRKKDPYEYVTPENYDMVRQCLMQGLYDMVRQCLMQGLHSNDPTTIVKNIQKLTDIPVEAIEAIVSKEIGGAFDAWKDKNGDNLG